MIEKDRFGHGAWSVVIEAQCFDGSDVWHNDRYITLHAN